MSVTVKGSNSCPVSLWSQHQVTAAGPKSEIEEVGWCSFLGLWLMYLRCLWKWIHVLFCSHCLGSMGLFTDTKKCGYSGSRIGIWHKTWYNLDTQLFEKKTCSWFFTDFLGLWGGRKAKTGLLYTGFAIDVSIFWQNITLFKGLKEKVKVCCGVFWKKSLIASLSHLVLCLTWNTVDGG